jgi:hypothetical protein
MLSTLAAMQNVNDLDGEQISDVRDDVSEMMVAMDHYEAERHIGGERQGSGEDLAQMELPNDLDEQSSFITWSTTEEMGAAQAPMRAFDLAYESSSQSPSTSSTSVRPSTRGEGSTYVGNPSPATSRFSTIVGNRDRIVIDLDDDDEPSEMDEPEYHREEDNYVDADEEEYVSASEGEGSEPKSSSEDTSGNEHPGTDTTSPLLDPDTEPPFVTDGRGRVVWSSGRSGRSGQNSGSVGGGRPRPWSGKVNTAAVVRKSSGDGVPSADFSESEMEGRLGDVQQKVLDGFE